MRKLGDLLKKNGDFRRSVSKIGEKDIESVFFSILQKELPSISRSDIQNFRLRDKKIYLKIVHPAIASEIWRKREKFVDEVNKQLNQEVVGEIKVK